MRKYRLEVDHKNNTAKDSKTWLNIFNFEFESDWEAYDFINKKEIPELNFNGKAKKGVIAEKATLFNINNWKVPIAVWVISKGTQVVPGWSCNDPVYGFIHPQYYFSKEKAEAEKKEKKDKTVLCSDNLHLKYIYILSLIHI